MPCFYPFYMCTKKWPISPVLLQITYNASLNGQSTLLGLLLKGLDHVADFKAFPALEAHTTLGASAHFLDVLLDVLKTGHGTCFSSQQQILESRR